MGKANPYESPQGTGDGKYDPVRIIVKLLRQSVIFVLTMLFYPIYTYRKWSKIDNYERVAALICSFLWCIDVFLVVSLIVGYNWMLKLVEYYNAIVS